MTEPVDLEAVLEEIRQLADEARRSGVYPDGLEEQLQSDFSRQQQRRDPRARINGLRHELAALESVRHYGATHVPHSSSIVGGSTVHRALAKATSRQVNGVYQQLRGFTDALVPILHHLVEGLEDPKAHIHDDIVHELDTLQDRVGELQRTLDDLGVAFRDSAGVMARMLDHLNEFDGLSARLASLEEVERRRRFDPFFEFGEFEAFSRGSEESIAEEYGPLAARLAAAPGPVIDLGAGRGELLSLMASAGAECWGVELDESLVEHAVAAGLDMRHGDAIEALRAQPVGSLGGIVLIHVIEHLTPNELLELVQLASDRLVSGGLLVLETPNPQSLYVYARAFWLDPTHSKPVHPLYLDFIVRQAHFEVIQFEWTALPAESERLMEPADDSELGKVVAENARRVNELVFAAQNYRLVAVR